MRLNFNKHRHLVATRALAVACTSLLSDCGGQAAPVRSLLERGERVIAVALRLPYNFVEYLGAPAYVCAYSLQPPSPAALSDALFGKIPFEGRLPVTVTGLQV